MGESGLNEDPSHEAEGAGSTRFFGLDLERFLSKLLGFGAPLWTGVPNAPRQDRTVVSTRQGESLTRLSSCPSVS
jgi:hypothetical protein